MTFVRVWNSHGRAAGYANMARVEFVGTPEPRVVLRDDGEHEQVMCLLRGGGRRVFGYALPGDVLPCIGHGSPAPGAS
jgi:hypothetical protein